MFNIDFSKYRVIDLSCTVRPGTNPERPFDITVGYLADGSFKHDIRTHSHVGAHVEVAAHFFEDGKCIMDYDLAHFMGRAVLVDVPPATGELAITGALLQRAVGDSVGVGDILICRNLAEGQAPGGEGETPYLTPSAAEWLVERNAKMLGIHPGVRLAQDIPTERKMHEILLGHDIIIVEFLANLQELRRREFYFMALPQKVEGLDSSMVRAIAIEEL